MTGGGVLGRTGMMASISGCLDEIKSASDLPVVSTGPADSLVETTSLGLVKDEYTRSEQAHHARWRRHWRRRGGHGLRAIQTRQKRERLF